MPWWKTARSRPRGRPRPRPPPSGARLPASSPTAATCLPAATAPRPPPRSPRPWRDRAPLRGRPTPQLPPPCRRSPLREHRAAEAVEADDASEEDSDEETGGRGAEVPVGEPSEESQAEESADQPVRGLGIACGLPERAAVEALEPFRDLLVLLLPLREGRSAARVRGAGAIESGVR